MAANRNLHRLLLLSEAFLLASQHEIKSDLRASSRAQTEMTDDEYHRANALYEKLGEIRRISGADNDQFIKTTIALNDIKIGIVLRVLRPEYVREKLPVPDLQNEKDRNCFTILEAHNHLQLCQPS